MTTKQLWHSGSTENTMEHQLQRPDRSKVRKDCLIPACSGVSPHLARRAAALTSRGQRPCTYAGEMCIVRMFLCLHLRCSSSATSLPVRSHLAPAQEALLDPLPDFRELICHAEHHPRVWLRGSRRIFYLGGCSWVKIRTLSHPSTKTSLGLCCSRHRFPSLSRNTTGDLSCSEHHEMSELNKPKVLRRTRRTTPSVASRFRRKIAPSDKMSYTSHSDRRDHAQIKRGRFLWSAGASRILDLLGSQRFTQYSNAPARTWQTSAATFVFRRRKDCWGSPGVLREPGFGPGRRRLGGPLVDRRRGISQRYDGVVPLSVVTTLSVDRHPQTSAAYSWQLR